MKKGDSLGATRVIPLVIEAEKMAAARAAAGDKPLFSVLPFQKKKVGIITTGNEVFTGRVADAFGPAIRQKLAEYDAEVLGQTILGDDPDTIAAQIAAYIDQGADMVLCTGGMSVDPDDTHARWPSRTQRRADYHPTARRCCPGPCSCSAYRGEVPGHAGCPAA